MPCGRDNGVGHKNFYGMGRILVVMDYFERKGYAVNFGYPPEYTPAVTDNPLKSF